MPKKKLITRKPVLKLEPTPKSLGLPFDRIVVSDPQETKRRLKLYLKAKDKAAQEEENNG